MTKRRISFFLFIFFAFILRLFLAPYLTHTGDLSTFKAWAFILTEEGFDNFYSSVWSDYLPGYLYVLSFLGNIYHFLTSFIKPSFILDVYLFKMPSILTDLGNGFLIYLLAKNFTSERKAFLTGAFVLFTPAFLSNSALWGQADSFLSFFLLLNFYLFTKKKIYFSAIALGLAQTIKPIAILALPFFILYLLLNKTPIKILILYLVIFFITIVVIFLPFNNEQNIFHFIMNRHLITSNQYPYTSLNAFNIWTIRSNFWISDEKIIFGSISYHILGIGLFAVIYITLLINFISRVKKEYFDLSFTLAITYLSMFVLLTRMHERHMFYAVIFLTLLLPKLSRLGKIAVLTINIMYTVNLYFAFAQLNGKPAPFGIDIVEILSALNVALLIFFYGLFILNNDK